MTTGRRGRVLTRWFVLLALVVMPLLAPVPAQAHALLVTSTPADGATVALAPRTIRLEFSEAVQVAATVAELYSGGAADGTGIGTHLPTGAPTGPDRSATSTVVDVPMPDLGKGRFLLRWRTISADDLHPTEGSLVFGVGLPVTAAAADPASGLDLAASVLEALLRWAALLALGVALAALALSLRLARTSGAAPHAAISRPVLPRATKGLIAFGALATMLLGVLYVTRIVVVLGVVPGSALWQLIGRWAVAVAASLLAWGRLPRPGPWAAGSAAYRGPIALLALSLAAVTSTSHAASAGIGWAALGAVHTVTTLLWASGAVVVAIVAVRALRSGQRTRAVLVARTFTPIALACVPISLITGLVLAGRLLPSVGALLHTGYGHALLVKLALLVLALACAGGTVVLLVRGAARRHSALVVGVEATILCAVVLAASAMAAIHPASRVQWGASPQVPATSGTLSQLVDDLVITVGIGPGRPGRNFVLVNVLDTRRPAPEAVSEVRVSVDGSAPLVAVPRGEVEWVAVEELTREGRATLEVWADRPGLPTASTTFTWQVAPPAGTRIGGSALAPYAAAAAVALALLVAAAAGASVVWGRRRRRHGTSGDLPSATEAGTPSWSGARPSDVREDPVTRDRAAQT